MKNPFKVMISFVVLFVGAMLFTSFREDRQQPHGLSPVLLTKSQFSVVNEHVAGMSVTKFSFPYRKQGLSTRQAAAHLLSRFTYGGRQDDVDAVVKLGLEKWFLQQLDGQLKDDSLDLMLQKLKDINLSNTEVENQFPGNARTLRMAMREGAIDRNSVNKVDNKAYRDQLQAYMKQKGLKPSQELYRQFISQKILRATYTENQLRELMTDFWFNHFNVSLTKNQCASFVPAYERDVIRPNVTGDFETLLMSTAKSPAMLIYLDNFRSSGQPVTSAKQGGVSGQKRPGKGGLNENYAREVMELHTLGVDGGYTQRDVTEAARVLTGWTIAPMGEGGYGSGTKKLLAKLDPEAMEKKGYVREGDFLFVPGRHDNAEKEVLGHHFSSGGGYQEGVALLQMLAHHPSTAVFISKKLAVRFVNDHPAQQLIDKMAATFIKTEGDISEVMITMVSAPEFWSPDALREKTKSPFELAISAVRSLDAQVRQPYQLFTWISKMGQKIYYFQAPTGFPDRGQYWINTGALLNRMNFGLALAAQRIPGVRVDLAALNGHHEPESAEAALLTYSKLMLPERDVMATTGRLKPMLNDPSLSTKVAHAAESVILAKRDTRTVAKAGAGQQDMLAQVVGVIIGSPEFQRK
ncbi:hypothetical protein PBAL39_09551 [Pedobacter sp. BAL39]|uniref:DUF1800 domain-containing protein n=1 Tax=Pedobacter sp. BAL39 TaxID=391596 RepID=UPI0001559DC9|nr:DUF1800 domain-containing protein [Pedobacter sp. BAL39]EDM37378.1 hypothetical protein PBAL39_09551 [Pedobacter sp. BAL39]